MADLIEWLRAQIDEDEQWALAANRPYEYAEDGSRAPETGVHWQWVIGENWEPTTPDPALNEFVAEPGYSCNLATVETWPSRTAGRASMMPRSYAHDIVEMDSAAAGHIARHDPARVLREVEAKRRILDEHAPREDCATACKVCSGWYASCGCVGGDDFPCTTVHLLAAPYSDRPGYREEWRP